MLLLVSRDVSHTVKTCSSVSWHVWCPVDIVLWALITLILALLLWRMYRGKTKQLDSDHERPNIAAIDPKRTDCAHAIRSPESPVITNDLPAPPPALLTEFPKKLNSHHQLTGLGITFDTTSSMNLSGPILGISKQSSRRPCAHFSPVIIVEDTQESTERFPPPAYVCDVAIDKA